jgi:hypothetical protein
MNSYFSLLFFKIMKFMLLKLKKYKNWIFKRKLLKDNQNISALLKKFYVINKIF